MPTPSIARNRPRTKTVDQPRRVYGTGSVRELKTGRHAGKWRGMAPRANGKRPTFLADTKEEVEAWLLDVQHAAAHNTPAPSSRKVKLARYATEWSADRKRSVRPKSWHGDDSNVRNHIIPSLGHKFVGELEPPDMRRLYRECAERGLSARSIHYVRGTLSLILDQAVLDGLVGRNVAKLVKSPKFDAYRVTPFTPDEARKFLDEVAGTPAEALYVTTLGLGLRRGEVLGMRWADIDWTKRQIALMGQAQRVKGEGVKWVATKTSGSVAVLDVPDFVLEALLQERDRRAFLPPSPYVFPGVEDPMEPFDPDKATDEFPVWLEAHGLRRIRFHDLRHSAASMYLALGVPLWQVSKILRHSTQRITADIYGHLYAETSREVADVMDTFMRQAR